MSLSPANSGIPNKRGALIEYFLIDKLDKICESKALKNNHQYYIYVSFCLKTVQAYFDFETREKLNNDFRKLESIEKEIMKTNEDRNNPSKIKEIENLRYDFCEKHEGYIMSAFSRMRIIDLEEEGVIDFEKLNLEQIRKIVTTNDSKENIENKVLEIGNAAMEPK
jgi:hypothetical protein